MHPEQRGVVLGRDRHHLDRRLEGVLGQDLDEVLTGRHRGGVAVGEEQLDPHRSAGREEGDERGHPERGERRADVDPTPLLAGHPLARARPGW